MNVDEIINKNKLLEEELHKTKEELIKTKEHLNKYTSPVKNKIYYENNKEVHITKNDYNTITINSIITPTEKLDKTIILNVLS